MTISGIEPTSFQLVAQFVIRQKLEMKISEITVETRQHEFYYNFCITYIWPKVNILTYYLYRDRTLIPY